MNNPVVITYYQYQCEIYKGMKGLWKVGFCTNFSIIGESKGNEIKRYIKFLKLIQIKLEELNDNL